MRVIAFVSPHERVGKTVLACNVAVRAEIATGLPSALIEIGGDRSLGAWRDKRLRSLPLYEAATPSTVRATLERFYEAGMGLVVIDVPSPLTAEAEEILASVDLVVLPVAPKADRLAGLGATVGRIEALGVPFVFVVNGGSHRQKLTGACAMALAQHGTVSPVVIPRRNEFAETFACGRSVVEDCADWPETAAIVDQFWTYLDRHLARLGNGDTATARCSEPAPPEAGGESREQRQHRRWPLHWDVELARGDDRWTGRLVDISGGGAALTSAQPLAVGQYITLQVPTLGGFEAVVVRVQDERVGVRFTFAAEDAWKLAQTLAERIDGREVPAPAQPSTEARSAPPSPAETRKRLVRVALKALLDAAEAADRRARGSAAKAAPAAAGRVIVLGNEKGGSGKSTLALHLAIACLRAGLTAATVDIDGRQQTLTRYLENRRAFTAAKGLELPMPRRHEVLSAGTDIAELQRLLADVTGRANVVIVDAPGQDTPASRTAHGLADVIITPINDSFLDLDVLAHVDADSLHILETSHYGARVIAARESRRRSGRDQDWIVVRNRLSPVQARNKADMADALDRLAGRLGFRIGPGLAERVCYRELFPFGLTLLDLRAEGTGIPLSVSHVAARQELQRLLDAVLSRPAPSETRAAAPSDGVSSSDGCGEAYRPAFASPGTG
jgi:chromosome partitioning protein